MLEFAVSNQSPVQTISDLAASQQGARRQPTATSIGILRRITALMPRTWGPLARRGLSVVSAQLPAELRQRMLRLIGLVGSELGSIEYDYPNWIARHDSIDAEGRRRILAQIAQMTDPPLISILMPVFNPAPNHLRSAIRSVQDQFYPWWELCIADDASTDPKVNEILAEAAACDQRIKLLRRKCNGHISAASNSALQLANGLFVALLDHDDLLAPNALYEVGARIAAQPDIDIFYSDEDHIDDQGRRSHPYFKPNWSPELLLGQNLISHLGVYRRTLVQQIGGFRLGLEGSQDHDLALRAVAQSTADRIVHIPAVLYHWRQGSADRTFSQAARDRCVRNSRLAIADFIARENPGATIAEASVITNWTRVVHPTPAPEPLVSIVVYSSTSDNRRRCIDDLFNHTDYRELEILVVSLSEETTPTPFPTDHRVRVLDRHLSVPNGAIASARGDLVLLLDPSLRPGDAGWLREMVSHAIRPGVGAVGAKLLDPGGRIRHAGIALGGQAQAFLPYIGRHRASAGYFGHLQLTRDVTAVSSACLLLRRQVFLDVGGFDEVLWPSTLGDLDLGLKLVQAGLRNLWTPYAELSYHNEGFRSGSTNQIQPKHAMLHMRQKWGDRLDTDPYWNPNLEPGSGELALNLANRPLNPEALQAAA